MYSQLGICGCVPLDTFFAVGPETHPLGTNGDMRARNLKPGLFRNELLGTDLTAMVLFEGLWCIADRDGILEDRPARIKADIFPYLNSLDINGELTKLERWGFIQRYESSGSKLIFIPNFCKHQNPHHTEKRSEWTKPPLKSNGCGITVKTPLSNGEYPADSLIPDSLIPDSLPSAAQTSNPFNPTEAAVSLAREYGIIGFEEISLLKDALTFQQGDPMDNAKLILDAWLEHKESGAFPQQFKAFIKQGHWKPKPKPKRKYLTDDDEYTQKANA